MFIFIRKTVKNAIPSTDFATNNIKTVAYIYQIVPAFKCFLIKVTPAFVLFTLQLASFCHRHTQFYWVMNSNAASRTKSYKAIAFLLNFSFRILERARLGEENLQSCSLIYKSPTHTRLIKKSRQLFQFIKHKFYYTLHTFQWKKWQRLLCLCY